MRWIPGGRWLAGLSVLGSALACTCSDEEAPVDGISFDIGTPDADTDTDEPPPPRGKGKRGKRGKRGGGEEVTEPEPGSGGGGGGGGGGGNSGPRDGIVDLGNGRWNVDRKLVDMYESNPEKLGCSAKEKGKGYELTGVGPNDDAYALGARNGDVVMEVNGMPMDTMTDLLFMWSKLEGADDLDVRFTRDGASKTHHYHVVD
ncbi:MAG: hypothetical protein H6735_26970 [Alphaproteobacteria bacterium]|nr:hypothetical protein [Alphaproteobacteria bacterium]